ncbi:hypothetical protein [Rhizobium sp. SEMIA4064]|uniref:Uncharacterized protein n=1 Tax=Rhizobium paranaense TaxID=1650438 RepID=A0A7W8XQW3_9HYPH|nr:hypothetical protein [Rhizobium sp. SEMIA4064]MBB5573928.1 hypothetical protein [Rhizobium paranaense]
MRLVEFSADMMRIKKTARLASQSRQCEEPGFRRTPDVDPAQIMDMRQISCNARVKWLRQSDNLCALRESVASVNCLNAIFLWAASGIASAFVCVSAIVAALHSAPGLLMGELAA